MFAARSAPELAPVGPRVRSARGRRSPGRQEPEIRQSLGRQFEPGSLLQREQVMAPTVLPACVTIHIGEGWPPNYFL